MKEVLFSTFQDLRQGNKSAVDHMEEFVLVQTSCDLDEADEFVLVQTRFDLDEAENVVACQYYHELRLNMLYISWFLRTLRQ